jgi:hypothetical protein
MSDNGHGATSEAFRLNFKVFADTVLAADHTDAALLAVQPLLEKYSATVQENELTLQKHAAVIQKLKTQTQKILTRYRELQAQHKQLQAEAAAAVAAAAAAAGGCCAIDSSSSSLFLVFISWSSSPDGGCLLWLMPRKRPWVL